MTRSSRRLVSLSMLLVLPWCLAGPTLLAQTPRTSVTVGSLSIEPGRDLLPSFSDPNRVRTILKLIEDVYYGRPLAYPKDGTIFSNKEGRLPAKPKGFYREYTVMPPLGSPTSITVGDQSFYIPTPHGNRGTERLIIGGEELAYYTPDHYATFIQLTVVR